MLQRSATATFPDPGYHPNLSTLINMTPYNTPDLSSLMHQNGGHQVNGSHHPVGPINNHPSGELFIPSASQHHLPLHQPPTGQPQRHHSASSPPNLGINSVYTTGAPQNTCCLGGASVPVNIKDSRWLTLEVCRQYQRNQCTRTENECKFAHPPTHVDVQNGRVVCCYDSIKGKCQRRDPPCKYLHPPQHLREQLMVNGRNSMILRNMQLQFLHQQFLAQRGAAAVAAAVSLAAGNSNPSPHSSLIYPGTMPLALTSSSTAPGYPVLNFGFSPYALTNATTGLPASITGHDHLIPTPHLTNEHVTTSAATLNGFSGIGGVNGVSKRLTAPVPLTDSKGSRRVLPVYFPQSSHPATSTTINSLNGSTLHKVTTSSAGVTPDSTTSVKGGGVPNNAVAMLHPDGDNAGTINLDTGSNCVFVMNGSGGDNSKSLAGLGTGNNTTDLTAANIYAIQPSTGVANPATPSTILSLHPASCTGQQHAMVSLAAVAAAMNGSNSGAAHPSSQLTTQYQAEQPPAAHHAAYIQQAYHVEIPPFSYQ